MRGKGNQNMDEEEYEDGDFGSRKDGPSSNIATNSSNSNANNNSMNSSKDGKNSDKANAMRSKHSVTEQRRRSKINERFQMLRDLIPHSDQKRDTASFLLEVIEYVQFLQERVQKYEGTYQGWSPEPTKLMPWRNSHWRVQNFVNHPQATKNGSGPGSLPGKFDENNMAISPTMLTSTPNPVESDLGRDVTYESIQQESELVNKGMPLSMPLQTNMPALVRNDSVVAHPLQRPVSDAQSAESPICSDKSNRQDELTIEGGTINISSVYSEGLLNTLAQALQSAGIDLTQANISVQIDLGKRAHRGLTSGPSIAKDSQNPSSCNQPLTHFRDASSGDDSDRAQKRQKT